LKSSPSENAPNSDGLGCNWTHSTREAHSKEEDWTLYDLLFALALVSLILIPLEPSFVRLRIRLLRLLHWNWATNLAAKNFNVRVLATRITLLVIAATLLYFGWEDLRAQEK
tara:strand:- start:10421 stop:10756 length:336 start_codon:yes stop_codon:yes gene_type:complete